MNVQFQSWFSQGKAVDALCGLGNFFIADLTYREEHDFVLAVSELMEWARRGNQENAAKALVASMTKLLDMGRFEQALRLLRSYLVLTIERHATLPIQEDLVVSRFGKAARDSADRLSKDEGLRNLLLSVSRDFPPLRAAIGLS